MSKSFRMKKKTRIIRRSVRFFIVIGTVAFAGKCLYALYSRALCSCMRIDLALCTVVCVESCRCAVAGCLQRLHGDRNRIFHLMFLYVTVCSWINGDGRHNSRSRVFGLCRRHASSIPRGQLCRIHFRKGVSHITTGHSIHVR